MWADCASCVSQSGHQRSARDLATATDLRDLPDPHDLPDSCVSEERGEALGFFQHVSVRQSLFKASTSISQSLYLIGKSLRPTLSILVVLSGFLGLAILRTEERRIGYEILDLGKEQNLFIEERKRKVIQIAKLTRPQHVENVAQARSLLRKVTEAQVIHLQDGRVDKKASQASHRRLD